MLIVKSDPEENPLWVSKHNDTKHCKKDSKVFKFIENFVIEYTRDYCDKNGLSED